MRILVVHFRDICDFPPVQNLINCLIQLKHEVTLFAFDKTGYCDRYRDNIQLHKLYYNPGRIRSIIAYYSNVFALRSFTLKYANEFDAIWTTTDSTVAAMGKLINKYDKHIMQLMELTEDCNKIPHVKFVKVHLLKYGRKAWRIVVPEYNRAEILSVWWALNRKPYILPNKTELDADSEYQVEKTSQEKINIIKEQGKKIILYQGIFTPERELDEIADYLKHHKTEYVLCVMGLRNEYVDALCAEYENVVYLPYITSPNHLTITRQADIGLLSYNPQNGWEGCSKLNVLYCAPNKIFEFTRFGIPLLGNDIPGLRYPVEMYRIGSICDFQHPQTIEKALKYLSDNTTVLHDNCLQYYASVNTADIIRNILCEEMHEEISD